MIIRFLLDAFLVYLLYKIIFELVVPVYKTTRHIKKGFQDMHNRMSEQMNTHQYSSASTSPSSSQKENSGDYIEFEEIK